MQNDKIFSEIVGQLVRTRFEANLLLAEMDALTRSIYKIGPGDFESTLNTGVRAKTAYALSQVLNGQNREEVLKNITKAVVSLKYVALTIAFEPTLETINRISTWVKQNLGEGVAMDITLNKSILGGAVIEYQGKIASFTLLSKVEDYFTNTNVNV